MEGNTNLEFYELLRDSYNSANFEELTKFLSEDVIYESQWVITPLIGRDNVSKHLKGKAKTILDQNHITIAKVAKLIQNDITRGANLAYNPNDYCVVVEQSGNRVVILMKVEDEKITRIDLCMPQLFKYKLVVYPNYMTKREVHNFGIEVVYNQLIKEEYKIKNVDIELGKYPQIVASKNNRNYIIVVHTEIAPFFGKLETTLKQKIVEYSKSIQGVPCFASVSIGSRTEENFNKSIAIRGDGFYANYQGLEMLG